TLSNRISAPLQGPIGSRCRCPLLVMVICAVGDLPGKALGSIRSHTPGCQGCARSPGAQGRRTVEAVACLAAETGHGPRAEEMNVGRNWSFPDERSRGP